MGNTTERQTRAVSADGMLSVRLWRSLACWGRYRAAVEGGVVSWDSVDDTTDTGQDASDVLAQWEKEQGDRYGPTAQTKGARSDERRQKAHSAMSAHDTRSTAELLRNAPSHPLLRAAKELRRDADALLDLGQGIADDCTAHARRMKATAAALEEEFAAWKDLEAVRVMAGPGVKGVR